MRESGGSIRALASADCQGKQRGSAYLGSFRLHDKGGGRSERTKGPGDLFQSLNAGVKMAGA